MLRSRDTGQSVRYSNLELVELGLLEKKMVTGGRYAGFRIYEWRGGKCLDHLSNDQLSNKSPSRRVQYII
jgi:hypothetical protein